MILIVLYLNLQVTISQLRYKSSDRIYCEFFIYVTAILTGVCKLYRTPDVNVEVCNSGERQLIVDS